MSIDLSNKFEQINEHWSPKIIGELNGQHVKIAKILGEFPWHKHVNEDELFYVIEGELIMRYRDREETLLAGQMTIVPKGIEHAPKAIQETKIMLFEPIGTRNTGDQENQFTKEEIEKI